MAEIESSEIVKQPLNHHDDDRKQSDGLEGQKDEDVLKFMDSLDSYLTLIDSLSSTLRQGWFDFASARYSMGSSRVNSVLLDLKDHPAATHLKVTKDGEPHFTLCKWVSVNAEDATDMEDGDSALQKKSNSLRQRHKDASQVAAEEDSLPSGGPTSVDDQVQKERSKSLAVFGKLVSPKLRAAQLSFETALETLVEIANVRASMLSAFDKIREDVDGTKD